jgi:hypothetical protein
LNEGGHLLLPDYDFLVLWNGFDMMPLKSLRVALSNIMLEVQRLDRLLPPSMVAIADNPLPLGDYTVEATKGVFGTFLSGVHSLTKADKLEEYDHFYDDYCIAHYLLGVVAKNIAFFPEEAFDPDMCALAKKSFRTVFRYAPYIKDDTYAYYFSHYNMGVIMMNQGQFDQAEEKFEHLLSTINPTLRGLPAMLAGKGRNSLEVMILTKAHAALFLLSEDRAIASGIPPARSASTPAMTKARSHTRSRSDATSRSALRGAMSEPHLSGVSSTSSDSTAFGPTVFGPSTSLTKLPRDFKDFPAIGEFPPVAKPNGYF